MKYTFVTVAHATDRGLLTLQARSMALYCPPDLVHEILIIENFDPGAAVDWRPSLAAEYGKLAERLRFVDGDAVCQIEGHHAGWWKQQVLKLAAVRAVTSPRYLVLDAKNHLFRPLDLAFLQAEDGRPKLNGYGFEHHSLKDALIRTLAYFGVDAAPFIPHFTRTSTPYLMLSEVCRDLIRYVEQREGGPFAEAFLARRLTEFFAYAGYLQAQGRLQSTYAMTQPYCAQIWGFSSGLHGVRDALSKAADPKGGPFLAVHRLALLEMEMPARRLLAAFWQAAGLFPSIDAGVRFSVDPNGAAG